MDGSVLAGQTEELDQCHSEWFGPCSGSCQPQQHQIHHHHHHHLPQQVQPPPQYTSYTYQQQQQQQQGHCSSQTRQCQPLPPLHRFLLPPPQAQGSPSQQHHHHHQQQHQSNGGRLEQYDQDWRPYHPSSSSTCSNSQDSFHNYHESNFDSSDSNLSLAHQASTKPHSPVEGNDPIYGGTSSPGLYPPPPGQAAEPGENGARLKAHSTPATLCWLERNYELCEGVCIPRNVVYFNYVDFCSKNNTQPVNAASFGKIIRQMFANLTTRRLGTRGQSRYHYYGLAVKPDSIYFSPAYSSKKFATSSSEKKHGCKSLGRPDAMTLWASNSAVSASTAVDATATNSSGNGFASIQVLPEFPSFREFDQASTIPTDKLQTLIMMYRVHCQRIMDSVNKFSFSEIPHLFTHFWQEIPPHISSLLGQNIVVTLIGVCDAILYRTILKAILPTAIQMFPENVLRIIRKFADDLVGSLQFSLKKVPDNLLYVKMKLVKQLSKMLKRRTSVNHLFQATCLAFNSGNETTYQLLAEEWMRLDVKGIIEECSCKACSAEELTLVLAKVPQMLQQRCSMSQFCLWINSVFEAFRNTPSSSSSSTNLSSSTSSSSSESAMIPRIRRFLVLWTSITSKLLKQIKSELPNSVTSTFHLLQLMLNEFLLHEIEKLLCEDSMKELMLNMVNCQATELSDSSFIDSLGPDFLSKPNFHTQETQALTNSLRQRRKSSKTQHLNKKIKVEGGERLSRLMNPPPLTRHDPVSVSGASWNGSTIAADDIADYNDSLMSFSAPASAS